MYPEKSNKIDRANSVKAIQTDDQPLNVDQALNKRFKYYVRVGLSKYAFRDVNNPKRYSLTDKPHFFYLEGQANESARLFRSLGHKVELIKEEAPNN